MKTTNDLPEVTLAAGACGPHRNDKFDENIFFFKYIIYTYNIFIYTIDT